MLTGIVQESINLRADDRVQCEIAAIQHDVVRLYVRIDIVDAVVGMVFIENVFRIVLLIEEGK